MPTWTSINTYEQQQQHGMSSDAAASSAAVAQAHTAHRTASTSPHSPPISPSRPQPDAQLASPTAPLTTTEGINKPPAAPPSLPAAPSSQQSALATPPRSPDTAPDANAPAAAGSSGSPTAPSARDTSAEMTPEHRQRLLDMVLSGSFDMRHASQLFGSSQLPAASTSTGVGLGLSGSGASADEAIVISAGQSEGRMSVDPVPQPVGQAGPVSEDSTIAPTRPASTTIPVSSTVRQLPTPTSAVQPTAPVAQQQIVPQATAVASSSSSLPPTLHSEAMRILTQMLPPAFRDQVARDDNIALALLHESIPKVIAQLHEELKHNESLRIAGHMHKDVPTLARVLQNTIDLAKSLGIVADGRAPAFPSVLQPSPVQVQGQGQQRPTSDRRTSSAATVPQLPQHAPRSAPPAQVQARPVQQNAPLVQQQTHSQGSTIMQPQLGLQNGPSTHHAAPPSQQSAKNLSQLEEQYRKIMDGVGAHMQRAWDQTLEAKDTYQQGVRALLTDTERHLHETRSTNAALSHERNELRGFVTTLQQNERTANTQIAQLNAQISQLNTQLAQTSARVARAELARLERDPPSVPTTSSTSVHHATQLSAELAKVKAEAAQDRQARAQELAEAKREIAQLTTEGYKAESKRWEQHWKSIFEAELQAAKEKLRDPASDVGKLRDLLARQTQKMAEVNREKEEAVQQAKAEQERVVREAEGKAEREWAKRLREKEMDLAKAKQELEAKDGKWAEEKQRLHRRIDSLNVAIGQSEKEDSGSGSQASTNARLDNYRTILKSMCEFSDKLRSAIGLPVLQTDHYGSLDKRFESLHSDLSDALRRFGDRAIVLVDATRRADEMAQAAEKAKQEANSLRKQVREKEEELERTARTAVAEMENQEGEYKKQFDELKQATEEVQKRYEEEKRKREAVQAESLGLTTRRNALEEELTGLRDKLKSMSEQVEEAEAARTMSPGADAEEKVKQLEARIDELEGKLARSATERLAGEKARIELEEQLAALKAATRRAEKSRTDRALSIEPIDPPPSFKRVSKSPEKPGVTRSKRALSPPRPAQVPAKRERESLPGPSTAHRAGTPLFLPEEEDPPVQPKKRKMDAPAPLAPPSKPVSSRVSAATASSSSAPLAASSRQPSVESTTTDAPLPEVNLAWVNKNIRLCFLRDPVKGAICKLCFIEERKRARESGISDAQFGRLEDRQGLGGSTVDSVLAAHAINHHKTSLRKLRQRRQREGKDQN